MSNSKDLKDIFNAGRPLVEQWLDIAEQFAAIRDAATEKGFDWSQVKALLKASVQDDRDGKHRVGRIIERADFASSYADMLGLGAKMNENIISPEPPADPRPAPIKPRPPEPTHVAEEYPELPAELDRRRQPQAAQ